MVTATLGFVGLEWLFSHRQHFSQKMFYNIFILVTECGVVQLEKRLGNKTCFFCPKALLRNFWLSSSPPHNTRSCTTPLKFMTKLNSIVSLVTAAVYVREMPQILLDVVPSLSSHTPKCGVGVPGSSRPIGPISCRLLGTIFEDTKFCGAVSDREGLELGPFPLHHPGWDRLGLLQSRSLPQPGGGPGDREQQWEPAGRGYLGMKCSKIIKGPAMTHGFELLREQVSVPLC